MLLLRSNTTPWRSMDSGGEGPRICILGTRSLSGDFDALGTLPWGDNPLYPLWIKSGLDPSACQDCSHVETKLNSPENLQVRHPVPEAIKMCLVSVLSQRHREVCNISQNLVQNKSVSEMWTYWFLFHDTKGRKIYLCVIWIYVM
jgi:hypothetical protein